jgi:ferredoxin-NADP reductase
LAGRHAGSLGQGAGDCLSNDEWKKVILREVIPTGATTAMYCFDTHGDYQKTGLSMGHYIAIRGLLDGDMLQGFYSPVSRPDDYGHIDIMIRTDWKGGPIVDFLTKLEPGGEAEIKGMGGPEIAFDESSGEFMYKGRIIRKISLLGGGTGIAPMIQVTRAFIRELQAKQTKGKETLGPFETGLKLLYAAESADELAFDDSIEKIVRNHKEYFSKYHVVNKPPLGWTEGIGFVTPSLIKQRLWYPPADDHFILICGPPIFEKIMCGHLKGLGFGPDHYYSFAESAA